MASRWSVLFALSVLLSCIGHETSPPGDVEPERVADIVSPTVSGTSWWDLMPEVCGDGMPHQGCPCEGGQTFRCVEPGAVGDCLVGEQECVDGLWTGCQNLQPSGGGPFRVINPVRTCGCDPDCREANDVPGTNDLTNANSSAVSFDPNRNGIVINSNETNAQYAWIANDPESTVSKLDLATGVEVGRYRVGLANQGNGCGGWNGCNNPSRTAVDGYGNAYVANRAFSAQGTVTKMAGDRSFCIDRNANGQIDTSINNVPMADGTDECVLWTVRVGGWNGVPRALSVSAGDNARPEGYPWVGLFNEQRFYRLDPSTGAPSNPAWGAGRNWINVGSSPYGAAIDRNGNLWFPNSCCGGTFIRSFNVNTGVLGNPIWAPWSGSYGIAVDGSNRVIMGGWPGGNIMRYDPSNGGWNRWLLPNRCVLRTWWGWTWNSCSSPGGRGIAVDATSRIYVASHLNWSGGWVYRIDPANGAITEWAVPDAIPVGVGLDFSGNIWTVSQSGSRADRINPANGVIDQYNTGPNPYTYSDFTGSQRAWFTAPEGFYWRDYDTTAACGNGIAAEFGALAWDAETPGTSSITFEGRTADTQQGLGNAQVLTLAVQAPEYGPVDVGTIYGARARRWLRVTAHMRAGGNQSPLLRSMTMRWLCQTP